jgi:hypothetical protein
MHPLWLTNGLRSRTRGRILPLRVALSYALTPTPIGQDTPVPPRPQ